MPIRELWRSVNEKLRGHYAYYGVSDNWPQLYQFRQQVSRLLYWALNRRSQRRSFNHNTWKSYLEREDLANPGKLVNLNPFTLFGNATVGSRMR